MITHRSRIAIATVAGLLLLAGSASQAGGQTVTGTVRVALAASSNPQKGYVPNKDIAFETAAHANVSTHAATTATASAVCGGCSGEAISTQVLYLDHTPTARLDNVAVAWDQGCTLCTATSVSVEVVVVDAVGTLIPNNRSVAFDVHCKWCRAASAAYQVVVKGGPQDRLSPTALAALKAWAVERARLLRDPSSSSRQASRTAKQSALDSLAGIVNRDLGTGTLTAHVRVSRS